MAWTSKAGRFSAKDLNVTDTPDNLGPGAYSGHERHALYPSCAPFNSTQPRTAATKDISEKQIGEVVPAPGAYDPKLPAAYDAGLPRKTVPFSSGVARLGGSEKSLSGPGPGQYYSELELDVLPCRTMGRPLEGRKIAPSASAPSIPSGSQCYGYEEIGNGRLVRQGPKDGRLRLSGENADMAGPGHYESVSFQPRAGNGGKFLQGAARQPLAAPEAPGPGHYAPHKPKDTPIYSSFLSTTTQRPEKKRSKKSSTPGPGHYAQDAMSPPSLREQRPEFQYFGSTSERFQGESSMAKTCPGPGEYAPRQRVMLKSDWGVANRFDGKGGGQTTSSAPGPGQYNPSTSDGKTTGVLGTASLLGSTGTAAFGSMESRRGLGGGKNLAPGPGAYDVSSADTGERLDGDRRTRVQRPKRVSSVNTAEIQRLREAAKEGHAGPPPGAYDPVHMRDIAAVMRLPPKGEGFLSGGARSTDPGAGRGAAPGPGMYNSDPSLITGGKKAGTFNRAVVEGVPESGRPRGLGFASQSRRFKGQAGGGKLPGPGSYHTDPNWTKKNFNVHFGDI